MNQVLLISEVDLEDESGRAADFELRRDMLEARGWELQAGKVPKPFVRTFLPSVLRLARTARREDVDVVMAASNPFHLQLVGLMVSTLSGVPWLAEFRDPMVENPDRDPDAVTTKLARVVEWLTVHLADHVVWGDGIQMEDDYFVETYGVDPETVTKLPLRGIRPERFESAGVEDYDDFTITYAGSFYDGWIEPYSFFQGLGQYVEANGESGLRVQFYGDWRPDYDDAIATAGLESVVQHHDFVPKEEVIPRLKGSDALLYIGGDDPENRLSVPSKINDYVGAKSPILAVVDPSFRVADIVEDNGLGVVVPYDDPDEIRRGIESLRDGTQGYDPDEAVFDTFDRKHKADALASILDDLVSIG
jgi:glycosyltransferase involved in cell wall biosynthesis